MTTPILLIDDEDDVREVLTISLEVSGAWEVFSAASGMEGLAIAIREKPAVILLDLMMPGLDGLAMLDKFHAHPITRKIPIILLTAKSMVDYPQIENPQVCGILSKLTNPLTLTQEIVALLAIEL